MVQDQARRPVCSFKLPSPHALCAGIVYGLYLTLSTWILYYVATKMNFFENSCHLPSLNNEARPHLLVITYFLSGLKGVQT